MTTCAATAGRTRSRCDDYRGSRCERVPPDPRPGHSPPLCSGSRSRRSPLPGLPRGSRAGEGDVMADLPARPSLDHLRRQARDLLRAALAGDTTAAGRIRTVSDALTLASAQLAVAREYGCAAYVKTSRWLSRVPTPRWRKSATRSWPRPPSASLTTRRRTNGSPLLTMRCCSRSKPSAGEALSGSMPGSRGWLPPGGGKRDHPTTSTPPWQPAAKRQERATTLSTPRR